jgi:hypothetical protein
MSLLNQVLRFLMPLVVAGLGLAAAAAAATRGTWQQSTAWLAAHPVVAVVCGLALFLLGLFSAWSGIRRHKREKYLCFDNEGGRVSISTQAIADYVGRLADEFPSIIRLKPIVVPLRSEIDVVADVRVKAGPQIHEICEVLQQRIRERLATGLGISQVRQVEVRVSEINTEHKTD